MTTTMKRTSIGGPVRYDLLAQQHRPTDEQTLAVNARVLTSQGLTPQDIGQALQLSAAAVTALLREAPDA